MTVSRTHRRGTRLKNICAAHNHKIGTQLTSTTTIIQDVVDSSVLLSCTTSSYCQKQTGSIPMTQKGDKYKLQNHWGLHNAHTWCTIWSKRLYSELAQLKVTRSTWHCCSLDGLWLHEPNYNSEISHHSPSSESFPLHWNKLSVRTISTLSVNQYVTHLSCSLSFKWYLARNATRWA